MMANSLNSFSALSRTAAFDGTLILTVALYGWHCPVGGESSPDSCLTRCHRSVILVARRGIPLAADRLTPKSVWSQSLRSLLIHGKLPRIAIMQASGRSRSVPVGQDRKRERESLSWWQCSLQERARAV